MVWKLPFRTSRAPAIRGAAVMNRVQTRLTSRSSRAVPAIKNAASRGEIKYDKKVDEKVGKREK